MAYISTDPRDFALQGTAPRAKRNLFRRLMDAIEQSNMRRAEREIARYLRASGTQFNDAAEREIERRFLSGSPRL